MNSILIKNIFWLASQQIISSGLSLIIMLVVVKRLGVDGWGIIAFLTSFAYLATLFVEYGFYISGQKEVIKSSHNINELRKLISNVISARILIGILVFLLFIVIAKFIQTLESQGNTTVIALIYGTVNGFTFYWILRGLGYTKQSILIEAAWKIFALLLVIIFVKNINDITNYFIILIASQIMINISYFIYMKELTSKVELSFRNAINGIKLGLSLSTSHITGSLFSIINPLTLGFLSSFEQVGIYSASEKLIRLAGQVFEPVKAALFILINEEKKNNQNSKSKIYLYFLIVLSVILTLSFYVFSEEIVFMIYGENFIDAVKILKILSVFPIILVVNIVFCFLWAIPNGYERYLTPFLLISILINLIMSTFIVPLFGAVGMAYVFLLSEFILAASFFALFFFKKDHLKNNE